MHILMQSHPARVPEILGIWRRFLRNPRNPEDPGNSQVDSDSGRMQTGSVRTERRGIANARTDGNTARLIVPRGKWWYGTGTTETVVRPPPRFACGPPGAGIWRKWTLGMSKTSLYDPNQLRMFPAFVLRVLVIVLFLVR